MLCYDDGLGAGKNLLALKTTDAKQEECSIWVYQCSSSVSVTKYKMKQFAWFGVVKMSIKAVFNHLSEQEQAQSICKVLSSSFDCALISGKSWGQRDGTGAEVGLEENLNNCKTSNSKPGDNHGQKMQPFPFVFSNFALREINWRSNPLCFQFAGKHDLDSQFDS